ncbi:hypothetical protein [Paenibacillus sp. UNC451MF]|uniref:hypothetical protein n=1 Tax=Paenibacillus sp. UNC451MF TaxID=1449063 RepID=UPI0004914B49|nr:hypothetical protein [Paenibacillus sp. UNC451MF]
MKIGMARAAATEWVMQYTSQEAWFMGAYFSGSTVGQPDDVMMSVGSDIDVVVVTSEAKPPLKLGKFIYRDALIEITFLSWNQIASVEEILTSYHLAGSFRVDTIIADPTGQLLGVQHKVSRLFAEREWVRRRCENVRQKIEHGLRNMDLTAPWHDQFMTWLFMTGVTTHVLLVAALRNPTVRLRYLAAYNVLQEFGRTEIYPELLRLLGCDHWNPQRTSHHLSALARTFDVAAAHAKTPFFFSSDITVASRPIAIDGSRNLIRKGYHREAVFWIGATFARCHKILSNDAPKLQVELAPSFEEFVIDLGISSYNSLGRRAEDVLQFLPRLWDEAESIMQANGEIL